MNKHESFRRNKRFRDCFRISKLINVHDSKYMKLAKSYAFKVGKNIAF